MSTGGSGGGQSTLDATATLTGQGVGRVVDWMLSGQWEAFWTGVGMAGAGMVALGLALQRWGRGR